MLQATYDLDRKDPRRDGTYQLKAKIYRSRSEYAFVGLKIYLLPSQWDGKRIVNSIEAGILNGRLNHYRLNIGKILLDIDTEGLTPSMPELRAMVAAAIGNKQEGGATSFVGYFEAQMAKIANASTRGTYIHALSKIREYDSSERGFSGITPAWLRGFEKYCLDAGLSVNSVSIFLRNIRATFNRAIDDGLAQMNDFPFRRFKIKHEATRKRSVIADKLRELRDYNCEPAQRQYRDMFMLIFYLRGINMIDLFGLETIENGYVHYKRAKTGRLYSVKIEPEALEIIERYRGEKHLLNIADRYKNYKNYLQRLNKNLKEIGTTEILPGRGGKKQKTGILPNLSTYYARHTWATIAAELEIPKETIAAGLGHGGNSVTDIYIDFDQRKVDAANRKIIDYLSSNN